MTPHEAGPRVLPFNLGARAICGSHVTSALSSALQDKGEGLSGDLVVRQRNQNFSISASDEYKGRVGMAANSSLLLSGAKLTDQRTFICMMVVDGDIQEFPIYVVVHSESTITLPFSAFECLAFSPCSKRIIAHTEPSH